MLLDRRTVLSALVAVLASGPALAAWPERPVTLIVPWAAGGGTDATGRFVAALLEKELGQPVQVVNRTGGGGIVGHTEIANAKADGYTLGVITTELSLYHWLGTSPLTAANYTPLALYNTDPQGLHVRLNGPETAKEAIAAASAKPGAQKASGANLGGAAHLGLVGLLNALKLPPNTIPWVPTDGSAPALQLLTSSAIEFVTTTMPEVQTLVDAKQVKTLAIMRSARDPAYPNVPTVKEALGVEWSLGAWRGVAGPANLPADVVQRLDAALKKVVADPEFVKQMGARKFGVDYADAKGFSAFLAKADRDFGDAAKAAGLAK